MSNKDIANRVAEEKKIYNEGIERKAYNLHFGHAQAGYAVDRYDQLFSDILKAGGGKNVLELGSTSWRNGIDFKNHAPACLTCINISEKELEKGITLAKELDTQRYCQHKFQIMDAHHLEFPDDTFDVVFGTGILHHLDFETAVKEIHRVCKPSGEIVFLEPLGKNPVGKLVRKLTPNARTPDERPLESEEFSILKKYFDLDNSFFQLFYVPAGWLSKFFFKSPYNPLMSFADKVDRKIEKTFKKTSIGLYFRYVLIHGFPRKTLMNTSTDTDPEQ